MIGYHDTLADARTLAAMLGVTLSADDGILTVQLVVVALDIDSAMRYQGAKFDFAQEREFPRLPNGPRAYRDWLERMQVDPTCSLAPVIWDWDPAANDGAGGAVVPPAVQMASIFQAQWMADPSNAKRLDAIRSGVLMKKAGGVEVQYASPEVIAAIGGLSGLGTRAQRLMERYRLRARGDLL